MSQSGENLKAYRSKRDFRQTNEPQGERADKSETALRFVIQKHDASTLHYDFRIEVDGVLKSWAVPKGPSTDPRERRLAVPTVDHPLDYADFEGVIPEGQYGAGTVLVWDRGTYRNMTSEDNKEVPPVKAIDYGHIAVWLEGEKLRGGYALTRMNRRGDEQWLLVKMDDEHADARRNPTSTQAASVLSGRTIEEITNDELASDAEEDD
jgi:DNA ligase D-like protein (predicted 3'-phosphoesterase)